MLLTVSMWLRSNPERRERGNGGTREQLTYFCSYEPRSRVPAIPRSRWLEAQPVLPPIDGHRFHDRDPSIPHRDNARRGRRPVIVAGQGNRRRQTVRIPIPQRLQRRPDGWPAEAAQPGVRAPVVHDDLQAFLEQVDVEPAADVGGDEWSLGGPPGELGRLVVEAPQGVKALGHPGRGFAVIDMRGGGDHAVRVLSDELDHVLIAPPDVDREP